VARRMACSGHLQHDDPHIFAILTLLRWHVHSVIPALWSLKMLFCPVLLSLTCGQVLLSGLHQSYGGGQEGSREGMGLQWFSHVYWTVNGIH